MDSKIKTVLLYAFPCLMVLALFAFLIRRPAPTDNVTTEILPTERATQDLVLSCTTDMATTYHIHPTLSIAVDGTPVEIPEGIGINEGTCMHPIHTHDASGTIHVESPEAKQFTLGDFFLVWGKKFDSFGSLTKMTVDGQSSTDGENLVFEDGQKIELEYATTGH